MTHLEKFVALYKEFGIDCKVNKDDDGIFFIVFVQEDEIYNQYNPYNDDVEITKSSKFEGYSSFFSDIEFDNNGNFIKQGFWE